MHYLIRPINTGFMVEYGYDDTYAFNTWEEVLAFLKEQPLTPREVEDEVEEAKE